jgi:hypothetical protein
MHVNMFHSRLGSAVARSHEEHEDLKARGFTDDVHSVIVSHGHGDELRDDQIRPLVVPPAPPVHPGSEYPKALHRADYHQNPTHLVVHNARAEETAKAAGWGPMPPVGPPPLPVEGGETGEPAGEPTE